MVKERVMNRNSQNSINQQWSLTPGRAIKKIQRHTLPSGKVVELQWISITFRDNQGIWRTEETVQLVPPTQDGSVVMEDNFKNLNECSICQSVTVSPYQCPECSRIVDLLCTKKTIIKEKDENQHVKEKEVRLCLICAKETRLPKFLKTLRDTIWGEI